jgi:uncharacterized protein YxjI
MTTSLDGSARHLLIKQRFTAMVNRYEIRQSDAHWNEGPIIGLAQQKRMKLREEVIFYTDDSRTTATFSFKARNVLDIKSVADIFDSNHEPIGHFRKDFKASLLRSTWIVGQAGLPHEYRGEERNMVNAILRRFTDVSFIPYHFDFTRADGAMGFSIVKKWGLRDKYQVSVFDPALDLRIVGAMGVALDALQNR